MTGGISMSNKNDAFSGKTKLPKDFFTASMFGTLMGCVVVVWVVSNVLSGVFGIEPKFTGFVVSIVVAYVALFLSEEKAKVHYVIAFFNGCLIYATVVGGTSFTPYLNSATASQEQGKTSVKAALTSPWVPDKNMVVANNNLLEIKEEQTKALIEVEKEVKAVRSTLEATPEVISPDKKNELVKRLNITEKSIQETDSIVRIRTDLLRGIKLKPKVP
jgi:hypothetical protein